MKKLLQTIFAYLRFEFGKKDKYTIVFAGYNNLKYNFNSKYLFEYYLAHNKNYKLYFIIDNDQLREQLNEELGPYFITSKTIEGLRIIFKAFTWITSGGMPVRIPFANRDRVTVNLWHGVPFKAIGLMNGENSWLQNFCIKHIYSKYDVVTATSERFAETMALSFNVPRNKVKILGHPWSDSLWTQNDKVEILNKLFDLPYEISKDEKVVLYAPTWRANVNTVIFPFEDFSLEALEDFLEKNRMVICLRTHQLDLNNIEAYKNCRRILILNEDKVADIMSVLNIFDILISDYSGMIFDYFLLDRPLILLPYDKTEYLATRRLTIDFEEIEMIPSPTNFKEFITSLSYAASQTEPSQKQQAFKNICHHHQDADSCKRHFDLIAEIIEEKYK